MIDPIPEMAAIASKAGVPFHVDACLLEAPCELLRGLHRPVCAVRIVPRDGTDKNKLHHGTR